MPGRSPTLAVLIMGVLVDGYFAGEGAVDQREVARRKNHPNDQPYQADLQAIVPALALLTVSEYTGFRAGSTMG